MRLSMKGQYGVRAMIVLTLLSGQGPTPLRVIAERENISEQFLEQIFRELREAGLVKSIRGAKGGYLLARDPEEIFIGDIIRVLEGPIAPVECVQGSSADGEYCERADFCISRKVWVKLRNSMLDVLDKMSLKTLCFEE